VTAEDGVGRLDTDPRRRVTFGPGAVSVGFLVGLVTLALAFAAPWGTQAPGVFLMALWYGAGVGVLTDRAALRGGARERGVRSDGLPHRNPALPLHPPGGQPPHRTRRRGGGRPRPCQRLDVGPRAMNPPREGWPPRSPVGQTREMSVTQLSEAPAVTLTIAGSEATGGAGAQADLKTFQELGVYGIVALTCIVSFDPKNQWQHRFVPVDQQVIADQLEAIQSCYPLRTVKLGMLGTPATIDTVASALTSQEWNNVVLDPVLICKGQEPGAALDTDEALKANILPLATFVTPNHFEAESLSGITIGSLDDLKEAARIIHRESGAVVLAKGGVRIEGPDAVDVFFDGETLEVLSSPKVGEVAVSGAGCTLAAAIAAELAKGSTPLDAARTAKAFVTEGIRNRVASNAPFDAVWQGGAGSVR